MIEFGGIFGGISSTRDNKDKQLQYIAGVLKGWCVH